MVINPTELHPVKNNNVTNEVLRDYAYVLRLLLATRQNADDRENTLKERYNSLDFEHKGFKERILVLEAKLREESGRNEDLQLKLNTLKAIEESIRSRTK